MFSRFKCSDRPRHMKMIGKRIVDNVDRLVGEQVLIRPIRLYDSELCGNSLSCGGIARRYGGNHSVLAVLKSWKKLFLREICGAEDPPAQTSHDAILRECAADDRAAQIRCASHPHVADLPDDDRDHRHA